MKNTIRWINNMKLEATSDGNAVAMDAKPPIGAGSAQTPKELVAAGLGGCTAMDVLALLRKHRQTLNSLDLDVEIESSNAGHPVVFTQALLTFRALGAVDPKILLEAVQLSQTKYCGVSAMLAKAFPIEYRVILNDEEIGRGKSDFGG